MLSVQEAKEHILSKFSNLPAIILPIEQSLGMILQTDIISKFDIPPFDNSSVDGFAVRYEDISNSAKNSPALLKIIGDIPAGSNKKLYVSEGECASIMTGAMMPEGANAVVMIEDTDAYQSSPQNKSTHVKFYNPVKLKENIRLKGSDISCNQVILKVSHKLRSQDIGVLAMLGIPKVLVQKKPLVAIMSSGDELVPVGQPLEPGQIHDSNIYMLQALLQEAGCEIINLGIAQDKFASVERLFLKAAELKPDLIISSAGVGTGAFDYVKQVIDENGSIDFWKVNMRPGKPLAFGHYKNIPFFGLPGNPVSSYVSYFVFVQPALQILNSSFIPASKKIQATLMEDIQSDGRESYLRAIIQKTDGKYQATLTGNQSSSNLLSLVRANALLIIPSGVKSCPLGTEVEAWLLES